MKIFVKRGRQGVCLLYTSDAADDLLCVDLGGRRIIKNENFRQKGSPGGHVTILRISGPPTYLGNGWR